MVSEDIFSAQYQLEIGLPARHNTITVIQMEMIISDSLQCPA